MAVHPISIFAQTAIRVFGDAIVEVVDDIEVETAVAIVVEKPRARAPFSGSARDTGLRGDVGECAVAVVVKQHVWSKRGDIQIGVAIVVVVADSHPGFVGVRLARPVRANARASGDVGERPVLVVVIERIRCTRRAVDEVQIREAVVVVIDPGETGTKRLDHELVERCAGLVYKRDARFCRDIDEQRPGVGFGSSRLGRQQERGQ
jgi:hypothetical protein